MGADWRATATWLGCRRHGGNGNQRSVKGAFAAAGLTAFVLLPGLLAKPGEMTSTGDAEEVVIMLHGLSRTRGSLRRLEKHLTLAGYRVLNLAYSSNRLSIDTVVDGVLTNAVARSCQVPGTTVHFVTHSIGGIVVRRYLQRHPLPNLGRVVMLAPPNQGSQLVDRFRDAWLFRLIHGPAGVQMATGADSFIASLAPVTFELGIIAGNRSLNPLYSRMISGPDDGVVAVERTKVDGMMAHMVMPYSHTFIMYHGPVIRQVIHFLRTGTFAAQDTD